MSEPIELRRILAEFKYECLLAHNRYRALHDAAPLRYDEKLNECAQEWADYLAEEGVCTHRPSNPYGENIYVYFGNFSRQAPKPKEAIESWYREGAYYKYDAPSPRNIKGARHFTQVIWKATKSMGLGVANGADGRFYLVCNYEPSGNVEGEFDKNVLPPKMEDVEVPPLEETGITSLEPKLDVVESMVRLYAVPSEKLRVWSIWLTKVGEIADEWQRWLRAHIDLTVRLSKYLLAAEEFAGETKKSGGEPKEILSDPTSTIADDGTKNTTPAGVPFQDSSRTGESAKTEDVGDAKRGPSQQIRRSDSEIREIFSRTDEEVVRDSSVPHFEQKASRSKHSRDDEGRTMSENKEESPIGSWPIGRRWLPLGRPTGEDEEESIQPLDIPRDEEQMRSFLKDFAQQATIYRSYYWHWKTTADQTIKEIGGRPVMATFKVQGRVMEEDPDALAKARARRRRRRRRKAREMAKAKSAKLGESGGESATADPLMESSARTLAKSEEEGGSVTTAAAESGAPVADVTGATVPKSDGGSVMGTTVQSETAAGARKAKRKEKRVDERFKDEARADEDLPFLFYLKTEPDIDIAIEHDDEDVIPADLHREKITGNYKHVYFNLSDKPCTGGKPWL